MLCQTFCRLKPEEQERVALLSLPMASGKQNHLRSTSDEGISKTAANP